MLPGKQILTRISCLLLVLVHISFIYFQAKYQLSVLQYNGLLFKQSIAKQAKEKESLGGISSTSTDMLSKSKLVPVKRFFQNPCILIPAPAVIARIVFIPYQFDRYTSPPVIRFFARIYPERGPPVAA
jgi:hypothetical protein